VPKRKVGHMLARQRTLDNDGTRSLCHHGRKGSIEFIRSADHHDRLNLDASGTARQPNVFKEGFCEHGVCRVGQNAHTAQGR
jgi:hypothetical protein